MRSRLFAIVLTLMMTGLPASAEAPSADLDQHGGAGARVVVNLGATLIGYPKVAENGGLTGEAVLEIELDENGLVQAPISVVSSSGHGVLDNYAVHALETFARHGAIAGSSLGVPYVVHVRAIFERDQDQGAYVGRLEVVDFYVSTETAWPVSEVPAPRSARKTVFRDLAWGDPVAFLKGAMHVRSEYDVDYYRRIEEDLSIGSMPVRSILYAFFQDRLMMVTLEVEDAHYAKRVVAAKFGSPIRESGFRSLWRSGDTIITLGPDLASGSSLWRMTSVSIAQDWLNWLDEQAAEDAASF